MRPARALLLLCLALATAVCASTGALTARVETLPVSRSAATLGGDLLLRSSTPFPAELREQVAQAGLDDSLELSLPTVAFAGERSQLINLRGVDAQWPLRGSARTQPEQPSSAPPPGVVWVDERLATALDVGPGAQVQIGRNELRVGAVLGAHPGQGNAGFSSLAPQALLRSEEIEAAGLLAEGARSRWYLYVAGPPAAIAALRSQAEEQGLRAAAPGGLLPRCLPTGRHRAGPCANGRAPPPPGRGGCDPPRSGAPRPRRGPARRGSPRCSRCGWPGGAPRPSRRR